MLLLAGPDSNYHAHFGHMEPRKNYGQNVWVSQKLPLQLPTRVKRWSVMSQGKSHQSPRKVSSQICYHKIFTVYSGKIKSLLDKVGLWLSAQPCCRTAGLAARAESWKRKYVYLEECAWRLTEVRDLIPIDQNYLETSLTSIPNSCWRALTKSVYLKWNLIQRLPFKMTMEAQILVCSQAKKYSVMEISLYEQWEPCYVFCIFFPFQPKPFHDWLLLILRKHLGGSHKFVFTS